MYIKLLLKSLPEPKQLTPDPLQKKSPASVSAHLVLDVTDNTRLNNLCGPLDSHLRQIEETIGVRINNRGNCFEFIGPASTVDLTERLIRRMYEHTCATILSADQVSSLLAELRVEMNTAPVKGVRDTMPTLHTRHFTVQAKTANQASFLRALQEYEVNFAVGPAGSGKTWLAVARAIMALENNEVSRLVLVRPAVEAGEHLGFLPGDLAQKVDPYLRPLFDSLHAFLGSERVARYIEHNIIEIVPLAYMRGRTLNEAFMILDEAQNSTIEQMKMFLTRIGFHSRIVVAGDITQTDLPVGKCSGLSHALHALKNVQDIRINYLTNDDVIRHPMIARILQAYDSYDDKDK